MHDKRDRAVAYHSGVIFLVLYALPVWALTYLLRRRVWGLLLLGLGTIAVPVVVRLEEVHLGAFAGTLHVVGASYAGLIGLVGIVLWLQRRAALAHECRHCLYDLTGNVTGVCPECGHVLPGVTKEEIRRAVQSGDAAPDAAASAGDRI